MLRENAPYFFRWNMDGIVALARARGVGVVLASFAYSELATDDPLVSEPFRFAMDQHNWVTEAVARDSGVPFFDFATVFPKTRSLWVGGLHLNREGAALKARYFADFLEGSGLLP
jgi:hypothetical protein